VLVLGFSVRGEKFSLFESSAGVGSKAMEGDFGVMSEVWSQNWPVK
jgi:hypothetical protein